MVGRCGLRRELSSVSLLAGSEWKEEPQVCWRVFVRVENSSEGSCGL